MAHLAGFGCCLPSREVSNDQLAAEFGIDPAWIVEVSGIQTRRVAESAESAAVMAGQAASAALESAGMVVRELGGIIVGTGTPDRQFPGISAALQAMLVAPNIPAFDVHLASVGGLFALAIATEMCERYGPILVVASERMSDIIARMPRVKETTILFGDGAGALVVRPGAGKIEIVDVRIQSDAIFADDLSLGFGEPLKMNGRTVILQAHRKMTESVQSLLERNKITVDDVGLWLFHQANLNLLQGVAKSLGIAKDRVFVNVDKYGNTSSASLLIAASEANDQGLMKPGYAVMSAFGAGMSWGAALLKIN